jgi:hypothetical protein
MRARCLLIAGLLIAGATDGIAGEEDAEALLERVAEAYGGLETIQSTHAVRLTGTTYSVMRNASGPIVRAYEHPDKLLVEIAYEGQTPERRVIMGGLGWRQGQPVSGPFHKSMVLQAARMALPRILFDRREELIDHGMVNAEDVPDGRVLEVPLAEGLRLFVTIDPGSGRIRRSVGVMAMGESRMSFGTSYEDFRMHEGRLVAFREIHVVGERTTGHTEVETISFPDDIPDAVFSPEGDQAPVMGPEQARANRFGVQSPFAHAALKRNRRSGP